MALNESVRPPVGQMVYRRPLQKRPINVLFYAVMVILALAFLFPIVWAVTTSLKRPPELLVFPPRLLPAVPQWVNYATVFERVPFLMWAKNTVSVVLLGTLGQVLSASLAAYAFARFEFKGRNLLFLVTLGTMMLPEQVTLTVAETLRRRLIMEGKVKSLTAQGKLQGIVMAMLPVGLVAYLAWMYPDTMAPMFDTWIGYGIIAICVVLEYLGYKVCKKIMTIDI